MQITRLDTEVTTELTWLLQTEKRGFHGQKVYANMFQSYVSDVDDQLVRHSCRSVRIWGLKKEGIAI